MTDTVTNTVSNLDRAKAAITLDLKGVFDPNGTHSSSLLTQEQIAELVDSLTDEEDEQFTVFKEDLIASYADQIISEFSPALREYAELFIRDHVEFGTKNTRIPTSVIADAIGKLSFDDTLVAMEFNASVSASSIIHSRLRAAGVDIGEYYARMEASGEMEDTEAPVFH
jgi:hypothetical protein